ncbi:2'-5' RNA ligase family protein [Streptomyces sioyaensis]|uniref:2'-5' RNA ligase family protein n=1 Tax=Streptomyces sioyaensis TaxID=67364 RepID=UPI001F23C496|nr:2'-5' RNA ligase family protein [Streptomyces sioyaensis]MCF3175226.1 2'-5' RNA ligase family protein [Streptomyces sioyaensis]
MTRWLGIALLPSAEHVHRAIRMQQEIGGDHALRPGLTADGNLPHVTVFQGPFTDSLDPETELEKIGGTLALPKELRLAASGIVYQPTGWVFLALERPPLLERLQAAALDALDAHLDRRAIGTKDTSRFSESERASFARYGYRYTGDAYAPHITLGRAEEQIAQEVVRHAPRRTSVPAQWAFDRLSFYVMGEHGAHAQTLTERPLDPA